MFTGLGGERLWLCPTLNDSANDISGNGNNGVYQGGMTTIADTGSGGAFAYDINFTSEYIDCGNILDAPAQFSISAWVNRGTRTDVTGIAGKWNGSGYMLYNSTPQVAIDGGPHTSGSTQIPASTWQHLAATYDGTTIRLYQDGIETSSQAHAAPSSTSATYQIGAYLSSGFRSLIDDVRQYDRVLTQAEITHLSSSRGVQGGPYYKPLTLKSRVTRLLSNRAATLLERIRSASKPTTPISIKVKHNEEPSYKAGYAKNAGESASPHLWNGLVGAWIPSLGVTGETLRDVSGNRKNGTLNGMDAATDWVATSKGLALDFDAVDDVADIASPPSITGDSATLALWCKSDDSAFWRSPGGYVTSGFDDYRLTFRRLNTGRLQAYAYYSSGGRQSTGVYAISNSEFQSWNYYVVVASGGVVYLYLNGAIVASGGSGSGDLNLGTTFTLGSQDSRSSGSWWNGKISNVQVYNRALPPQEIQELYVDSLAPFRRKKSPIGYQPIKEIRGLIKT